MYHRCSGQLIVGPAGDPIDINIVAVERFMGVVGVVDQADCLEKVQFLAGIIFSEQAKERQRKREAQGK